MAFCLGGHAQGDFIPTDQPQLARARGGCLEVGHRVLGVPWGDLSWSRWSLSEGPKPMEWARGLSFEGGQRWSRVQGFWGGRRQWQDGHGMFKIAAGWTSWPAVEVRAPWLEGRLSASRDAPWGNLRMEAMWTLGQRTSMAGSNDGVARAELPWGWTAWWTPNMDSFAPGVRHLVGSAIWEGLASSVAATRPSCLGRPCERHSGETRVLELEFCRGWAIVNARDSRHNQGIALHMVAGARHKWVVLTGASCGMRLAHRRGVFCGICGHGRARGCVRCLCHGSSLGCPPLVTVARSRPANGSVVCEEA